jgi:hypothetical protein
MPLNRHTDWLCFLVYALYLRTHNYLRTFVLFTLYLTWTLTTLPTLGL